MNRREMHALRKASGYKILQKMDGLKCSGEFPACGELAQVLRLNPPHLYWLPGFCPEKHRA